MSVFGIFIKPAVPLVGSFILAGLVLIFTMALAAGGASANSGSGLNVQPLGSGGLTATDLANSLVGTGVSVSNAIYTGSLGAAGVFTGGTGIIGFGEGVILSTGVISNVLGPNVIDDITGFNGTPGDADLDALLTGLTTNDAAVLEFDITPDESGLIFNFVFASEEYNEWVNSEFNDVFAFYINGNNCALVSGQPVSINTINNGNPYGTIPNSNPQLYINNDVASGAPLNTEMDGLTKVLSCLSFVNPGVPNHVKLAIADTSDYQFDSNVFLQTSSFISELPPRSYMPIVIK
jgi:hypothetical protein